MTDNQQSPSPPFVHAARLEAALAEYRALYGLAEFRLLALDRRIPAAGAAITAFVGTIPLLPADSQAILLAMVPVSLVWLVRTTINHARSFEDALRRIELLEQRINRLVGHEILGFQSGHPSKGRAVGGRTGAETIGTVLLAVALLLGACSVLGPPRFGGLLGLAYWGCLCAIGAHLAACALEWRRYRYVAREPEGVAGHREHRSGGH
ncbi:MAG: hypothetical protein AAFX79_13615 [Planctomycetota bacterium]